jgi:nucleoside-diphosphate-sugar epimerase
LYVIIKQVGSVMKILVTGGTGVVGVAVITGVMRRGHSVRLLSRHASRDVEQWDGVEAFPGDVAQPASIAGAAEDCDAVLHIAGIVKEEAPDLTFERVNVEGTHHLLAEAKKAGVGRFVLISSLAAERGDSDYHASKRKAEQAVSTFPGSTIVRLANVYGPGDAVMSKLLQLVRSLPIVPTIDGGDQEFQPIWHEDAALALIAILEDRAAPPVLALAGPERTTLNRVLDEFERLTDRHPLRGDIPAAIAKLGLSLVETLGIEFPFNSAELSMMLEGNHLRETDLDALEHYGITGTPISDGLSKLVDSLPEQTPVDGVGPLMHRRVCVDMENTALSADALFERFRTRFNDFVPIEAVAEPGAPQTIDVGTTLTLALPLRGNIQVRAQHVGKGEITLVTLEGHPLAGFVHFRFVETAGRLRFEIDVYDRAASLPDRLGMLVAGNAAQQAAWVETATRVLEASGGTAAEGVQHESEQLDGRPAERIDRWAREIVQRRKRQQENRT